MRAVGRDAQRAVRHELKGGRSDDAAEVAADDVAEEGRHEREGDGVAQVLDVGAREVDGGHVEHRFAGAVDDGGAPTDEPVRAVDVVDVLEHGQTARARERTQQHELGAFARDAHGFQRGGHHARHRRRRAAHAEHLACDHDGNEIGQHVHHQFQRAGRALDERRISVRAAGERDEHDGYEYERYDVERHASVLTSSLRARRLPAAVMSRTPSTPSKVLLTVAAIQGRRKSAGSAEPAAARSPTTVDGNICKLVADSTTSIIMLGEALVGAFSSGRMVRTALMPMGVAALPSPRRLALTFMAMYFSVSSLSPLNSSLTSGRSRCASLSAMPVFSSTPNSPSQMP